MSETKDRSYHHGDLRHALIDTALNMLATDQNWTFTLREVARRTGVSHAAPYKHFRDREELLRELARIGFDQLAETMTRAMFSNGLTIRERFTTGAQACIDFAFRNPGLYRLMFSADADKTADPHLHDTAMRTFHVLLAASRRGAAGWQFSACSHQWAGSGLLGAGAWSGHAGDKRPAS